MQAIASKPLSGPQGLPMRLMLGLLLMVAALLGGCASPSQAAPPLLLHEELFAPDPRPADAEQVLALSPAMRDYLAQEIMPRLRHQDRREALLDVLYTRSSLQLEYDSELTRTAAQAFAERRGNCLSLVLMTAAFARALELPLRFNDVFVEELWRRSGQLYVLSGHVNLSLGRALVERSAASTQNGLVTVDFLPPEQLRRQRSREIAEATVLAMYFNNRAGEALQQGRLDEAYWWASSALRHDARLLAAHNTLGVVYRRVGRADLAEAVLRQVLAVSPAHAQALGNLVVAVREQGRGAEADQLARQLAQIQPDPPYKFFDLGLAALQAGDYREAKRQFRREIERMAYAHEFHFGLALAHYGLGELDEAGRQLEMARELSGSDAERSRYAAKLAALRAAQQPADKSRQL